ncbi:MAG TPA: MlaD family protein [Bryobacteraceae bacterium]|nr:MlaD family protein [Bryobacteraceae bacterium]
MAKEPEQEGSGGSVWRRILLTALLVIVGLAVFALIARRVFLSREFDLSTLVDDSAGLAPSSPVMLNGIDVGHVVRVTLSGSPDPNKTVRILMRFPRRFLADIPEDSTAGITSANLLGDKYLNISRGTHDAHIKPGTELPSTPTEDIGTVLSRANVPLNQITGILARVDRIMDAVNGQQGTLGKLINNPEFVAHLNGVSANKTQMLINVRNARGVIARLDAIRDEVRKPLARLDSLKADMDHGQGSLGKFLNDPYSPTLTAQANATIEEAKSLAAGFNAGNRTTDMMNRMRAVSQNLDKTLSRIDSGQGTVGQFVINPQLRDSLRRMSQEMNRLTAAIKEHPTRFAEIRFGLF